ncbi:MAG: hypothetical protein U5K53_08545 [Halanaerobiales bacterium]|nr:hypothetical protein [Halanaerobiales bacterium]
MVLGKEFLFSYSLLVGSGNADKQEYVNRAYLMISDTPISNIAEEVVLVALEPVFSYSTIIGKVFQDSNANGIQDVGEKELKE